MRHVRYIALAALTIVSPPLLCARAGAQEPARRTPGLSVGLEKSDLSATAAEAPRDLGDVLTVRVEDGELLFPELVPAPATPPPPAAGAAAASSVSPGTVAGAAASLPPPPPFVVAAAAARGRGGENEPALVIGRSDIPIPRDPAVVQTVTDACAYYRVDRDLIFCLMRQESGGNRFAVSPKGASGYMQLMPDTARRFGVVDIFDRRQNIWAGVRYFRLLLNMFGDSVPLALAGYNAGEGRVLKSGYRVPNIAETRHYVRVITARYGRLKHVYVEPAIADARAGRPR